MKPIFKNFVYTLFYMVYKYIFVGIKHIKRIKNEISSKLKFKLTIIQLLGNWF